MSVAARPIVAEIITVVRPAMRTMSRAIGSATSNSGSMRATR